MPVEPGLADKNLEPPTQSLGHPCDFISQRLVGGIIPEADVPELKAAGVAAVYTPKDFELDRIMHEITALVAARHSLRV